MRFGVEGTDGIFARKKKINTLPLIYSYSVKKRDWDRNYKQSEVINRIKYTNQIIRVTKLETHSQN